MARAEPIQSSFNGGEVSPLLHGRTDLAAYAISVAELLNIIPTIQGGALKRSGSRFVAAAATVGGDVRLIGFEPQLTQAYMIEATNQAFRFYTNNALVAPGAVPYVLATPYLESELAALSWQQSNDVMYFAHGAHQQMKLARTGAASFAIAPHTLRNGPFKDANTNEAVTVAASGTTGIVTLTASSPIFLAGHVGAPFRIEAADFAATPAWEPAIKGLAIGDRRRSEGKIYQAATLPSNGSMRTGTIQPTHTQGAEWDGMATGKDINDKDWGGVLWQYVNDRYGTVTITAVDPGGLTATASVVRTIPSTAATWRWAHAAYSAAEGWPTAVCVWNERLIYARGSRVDGSVVGDFDNFAERDSAGAINADSAFSYTLASPNPIRWLRADLQLIVGTTKGEYAIGPLNNAAAPGPGNLQAPPQSFYGSNRAQPVQIGSKTMFVARGGRKVREAGYSYDANRYVANDTTVRAEHVTRGGVSQLAYQQEPYGLLWAVRNDGTLLSFTYSEEQEVRGWSRHVIGGSSSADGKAPAIVEAVGVIPDPSGVNDQVWLSVRRWINGGFRRYIERLEAFWDFGQDVADGFFLDSGLTYSGEPASIIAGLEHLAGQTVWVLADGASHPDLVVSPTGQVTLANAITARKVQIGLAYTARLTTLKLEAGGNAGTAQGATKKIVKLGMRLLEALAITVGPPGGNRDDVLMRSSADAMDRGLGTFTGDQVIDYPGSFERDGQITVESYQPLPLTLLALMPRVDTRG
jgi:hypothetical protein